MNSIKKVYVHNQLFQFLHYRLDPQYATDYACWHVDTFLWRLPRKTGLRFNTILSWLNTLKSLQFHFQL